MLQSDQDSEGCSGATRILGDVPVGPEFWECSNPTGTLGGCSGPTGTLGGYQDS